MFLGHATALGRALLDRALYQPKGWGEDAGLRAEAKVPTTVRFATKRVLARRPIGPAVAAGVPARCVTADSVSGSDYRFRAAVEGWGPGPVVGARSDEPVSVGGQLWPGPRGCGPMT